MWVSTWEFREQEVKLILSALEDFQPEDYKMHQLTESLIKQFTNSMESIAFYRAIHPEMDEDKGDGIWH